MNNRELGFNFANRVMRSGDVASLVFVELAQSGAFDDVTVVEHAELFLPWAYPVDYREKVIVRFGDTDTLYQCVQAHTSQPNWTPPSVPALWRSIGDPAEEWPMWSQPTGAHDAYPAAAKVTHKGQRWISDVDANVWEPGVAAWSAAPPQL